MIYVVVGAQWGSEAKGLMCEYLAKNEEYGVTHAVRTGSINAGHTVFHGGKPYAMQQIPVAWVNPKIKLIIGPGAYVHQGILDREIRTIKEALGVDSLLGTLYIDYRAGVHEQRHQDKEAGYHERFGSTGKGCSAAIIDKMERRADYLPFSMSEYALKNADVEFEIVDTTLMLDMADADGENILVEGTQGTMLDLHLGDYPFVTSRQATSAAWLAEAGLGARQNVETIMVARTYPIRVAGNSGPMANGKEILWSELARKMIAKGFDTPITLEDVQTYEAAFPKAGEKLGLPTHLAERHPAGWSDEDREKYSADLVEYGRVALSLLPDDVFKRLSTLFEITTVTRKLRRIAELDIDQLAYAVRVNGGGKMFMNFLNYKWPELYKVNDEEGFRQTESYREIIEWVRDVEDLANTKIQWAGLNRNTVVEL